MYFEGRREIEESRAREEILLKDNGVPLGGDDPSALVVKRVLACFSDGKGKNGSVTEEILDGALKCDMKGIIGTRHHCLYTDAKRELDIPQHDLGIFPPGSILHQKRHFIVGTETMRFNIADRMGIERDKLTPELLGWNLEVSRADDKPVYLDGLNSEYTFLIHSGRVRNLQESKALKVALLLHTQQRGCVYTGINIARALRGGQEMVRNFVENSEINRGTILNIWGEGGPNIGTGKLDGGYQINVGDSVFVRKRTSSIH